MQADVIHVMENGQIVEAGAHAELLAQEGRYAQAWRQQMQGLSSGALLSTLGGNLSGTQPVTAATLGLLKSRMDTCDTPQPSPAIR
jgi:ABC-type dipeptide/oligopeptide/nickel transport system ATPase component